VCCGWSKTTQPRSVISEQREDVPKNPVQSYREPRWLPPEALDERDKPDPPPEDCAGAETRGAGAGLGARYDSTLGETVAAAGAEGAAR